MRVLDLKDKRFWGMMLKIGLPIAIQNLIFNSLSLVDNVLVGGLGEDNIAAVGIAGKLSFIFMLFMFGINSGANIFSAQFWGKKDLKGVRKVLGLSLFLGLTVSIPFLLIGTLLSETFVGIFTDDPEVIRIGASYLRVLALTFPINAITSSYGMQSRGVGRTKLPLLASAIALIVNTVFTYLLVYGKLGFPMLGAYGAALATLAARILECFLLLFIIYRKGYELAARPREFTGYTKEFLARFIKPVLPVICNEVLWALGVTGYAYFYGRLGTEAFATVQILDVINGIFFSLFTGMGNACAAIIGNMIGASEEATARLYARRSIAFGVLFGFAVGIMLLITAPLFLSFFTISEATLALCRSTIIVYAVYTIPKVINMVMVVGVLRSGGDTIFAAMIDVGAPWFIGLPMAFLGVEVLALPIYFVMAMVNLEELVKATLGVKRLLSDKWLNNLVRDIHHEEEVLIS